MNRRDRTEYMKEYYKRNRQHCDICEQDGECFGKVNGRCTILNTAIKKGKKCRFQKKDREDKG